LARDQYYSFKNNIPSRYHAPVVWGWGHFSIISEEAVSYVCEWLAEKKCKPLKKDFDQE
jgi:hypothetical protein